MRTRWLAVALLGSVLAGCGLIAEARIVCQDVAREDCNRAVEAVRAAEADVAEAVEVTVQPGCPASCPPAVSERAVTVTLDFATGAMAIYLVDAATGAVSEVDI